MNEFEKWWYKTGSAITPNKDEDYYIHAKRVCEQFYNDVFNSKICPICKNNIEVECFNICKNCGGVSK